jgi:hypothetical protein
MLPLAAQHTALTSLPELSMITQDSILAHASSIQEAIHAITKAGTRESFL